MQTGFTDRSYVQKTFARLSSFSSFGLQRSPWPSLLVTPVLDAHKICLISLSEHAAGSSFSPLLTSFSAAVSFKSSLKCLVAQVLDSYSISFATKTVLLQFSWIIPPIVSLCV